MSTHRYTDEPARVMVIMRGLPGSGKTTKAHQIAGDRGVVFSTDDFFMEGGEYRFDPKQIGANHAKNQERARQACEDGISPIVIDNTNTQKWEARPYVEMARKYSYHVRFVEADAPWAKNPEELARRNVHGVSREGIDRMLSRYEGDFEEDRILSAKAPWER